MVELSFLFATVLFVDAIAIGVLLWVEHFTSFEGVILWEEDPPLAPLLWGSIIVLLAAIVSLAEFAVSDHPTVLVNAGGAVAPLAVSILVLWRLRPPAPVVALSATASTLATVFAVSAFGRAFFLPFPAALTPSIVASVVALVFLRSRLAPALSVAYVGATLGTLIGLDLIPLALFLGSEEALGSRLVVGGSGILDLLFLSGVFAVAMTWLAVLAARIVRWRVNRAGPGGRDLPKSIPRLVWPPSPRASDEIPGEIEK